MKPYLLALGAGLLVGVVYALLNVRSPAPPVVALVGLLGILIGEQLPPLMRTAIAGDRVTVSHLRATSGAHAFGALPTADDDARSRSAAASAGDAPADRAPS